MLCQPSFEEGLAAVIGPAQNLLADLARRASIRGSISARLKL